MPTVNYTNHQIPRGVAYFPMYLLFIYLATLLVVLRQILCHPNIRWLVKSELEGMRKEAVIT
jgi:hypothetical protein